ncbi:MAG: hypothetical protein IJY70_00675 [Clostridia bacterium]|nr:hypothetical protein [Clostridia bacterium]
MKKLRKILYILFLTAIALSMSISAVFCAYGAPYYYLFGDISAISVSSSGKIAVADDHSVYLLGDNGDAVKSISLNNTNSILSVGDTFYALANGEVYSISEDFSQANAISVLSGVSALASFDGNFYGVKGSEIVKFDDEFNTVETFTALDNPVYLVATDDAVLYSVKDGNYYSVYDLTGSLLYERIGAGALTYDSDTIYGLDRYGAIVKVDGSGETPAYNGQTVNAFTVSGGIIYFVSEFNSVYSIHSGNVELVAGSASSENGFYNRPTSFVARMGFTAVCDSLNNRVEITKGAGENISVSHFTVNRPTSLAIDNNGLIFVSHSTNKISAFTSAGVSAGIDYTLQYAIKKVVIDAENNIYCLCTDKIYGLTDGEFSLVRSGVDTVYAGDKLFYSVDNKVYSGEMKFLMRATPLSILRATMRVTSLP